MTVKNCYLPSGHKVPNFYKNEFKKSKPGSVCSTPKMCRSHEKITKPDVSKSSTSNCYKTRQRQSELVIQVHNKPEICNTPSDSAARVCGIENKKPVPDVYKNVDWPPEGKGKPCVCRQQLCKKIMRYVQPERPKDFKPVHVYQKATDPMDTTTVYKMSYLPNCLYDRPLQAKAQINLVTGGSFSGDTVHKMSYPGYPGASPARIIKPCRRDLLGKGPIQDVTTHKHDFGPKPIEKSEPYVHQTSIVVSDKPFEDTTVMQESYQPFDFSKMKLVPSFKPDRFYKKPEQAIDDNTTHKLSYVPWPVQCKEKLPWASKGVYKIPCEPMDGKTVYKGSYLPVCTDVRPVPVKPPTTDNLLGVGPHFDDKTVYRFSYLPICGEHKQGAFKAVNNIVTSDAKMDGNTVHKMSYRGYPGAQRANIIKPCRRDLLGKGPMQDITTNKHDYTPKTTRRSEPYVHRPSIALSDKPFEDTTVMQESYQSVDYSKIKPIPSFKPDRLYRKPDQALDDNTTHKMSYVPHQIQEKKELPWASRGTYTVPCEPMDGNTIYKSSFFPPGKFESVDCADMCCCPQLEPCGCYCDFPGECFSSSKSQIQDQNQNSLNICLSLCTLKSLGIVPSSKIMN